MSYRIMPAGWLVYPRARQAPKTPPEGYKATGDPHVYEPILKNCKRRETRKSCLQCGGQHLRILCRRENLFVNRGICKKCGDEGNHEPFENVE